LAGQLVQARAAAKPFGAVRRGTLRTGARRAAGGAPQGAAAALSVVAAPVCRRPAAGRRCTAGGGLRWPMDDGRRSARHLGRGAARLSRAWSGRVVDADAVRGGAAPRDTLDDA